MIVDHMRGKRPLGLLVFSFSMTEVPGKGNAMIQAPDYARRLAQNLVELMAPYEEELMQLEREAPAFGPLRRAVGIVIAEACYCISDGAPTQDNLVPPVDDEASRTR